MPWEGQAVGGGGGGIDMPKFCSGKFGGIGSGLTGCQLNPAIGAGLEDWNASHSMSLELSGAISPAATICWFLAVGPDEGFKSLMKTTSSLS